MSKLFKNLETVKSCDYEFIKFLWDQKFYQLIFLSINQVFH